MRLNNPLVLIPFPQKQKTQSVCPREAGSFWDMPPSPEGRKRPFECHVHWTPLLHLLSCDMTKNMWIFTVLLWVWDQSWAFRVFPLVIWCVSRSCYGFDHNEPHLLDTFHLFVSCLYVVHLPAAQALCFLAIWYPYSSPLLWLLAASAASHF